MSKLGETLLSIGALSAGALNRALMLQRSTGGRLGTILLEQGLVTEETLARALAKTTGRNYAHWNRVKNASRDVVMLVPARIAIRALAIPFEHEGRVLRVAMRDPNDLAAEDELALVTGKRIEPWVTAEFRVAEALERFYGERRSARFRVLSERLERGIRPPSTPAAPPPPPPDLRGERTGPLADLTPVPGRTSDVWKITREVSDEIEIATWRPAAPFVRPTTPTPTGELEFSIEELEEEAAVPSAPPASPAPPPTAEAPRAPAGAAPAAATPAAPSMPPRETPEIHAPAPAVPTGRPKPGRKKEVTAKAAPETAPAPPAAISLGQARERILSAQARDDIAEAVLDRLAGPSPLVALLIARKDDVIGWHARGEGVSRSALRSIRIPFTEPSIFLNVKLSGTPYVGLLPDLPSHEALLEGLGRRPGRSAVYPVFLKNRVVAFILAELPAGTEDLAALAASMAEGFAALILQQRGRAESA